MAVVAVMPLWFWTAWQLLGLGLMVFGAVAVVMAILAEWNVAKEEQKRRGIWWIKRF